MVRRRRLLPQSVTSIVRPYKYKRTNSGSTHTNACEGKELCSSPCCQVSQGEEPKPEPKLSNLSHVKMFIFLLLPWVGNNRRRGWGGGGRAGGE